ncbi:hypothetical protein WAI453_010946 [Rhynchosporium graminicola]|uniref:Uncharacterized protein n=1 Tax=Rhynchosporium graminicola TaxID=2792576 RepID=A0A1E1LL97_9HELO|nr:uncharacterized protein RCO7_09943 [Rhynchosporium commune]
MNLIQSHHWRNIQCLAVLFDTQQYSECAYGIRRYLTSRTTPGPNLAFNESPFIAEYYDGLYLILLAACCEAGEDKGRLLSFEARDTLRSALRRDPKSSKAQELLETLIYIAILLSLHFGGPLRKLEQPMDKLQDETKKFLRGKSVKDLGLEALMVHYALSVELGKAVRERAMSDVSCTAVEIPYWVDTPMSPPEECVLQDYCDWTETARKRRSSDSDQPGSESPPKRQRYLLRPQMNASVEKQVSTGHESRFCLMDCSL